MGHRGPPPTPTHILALRGSKRAVYERGDEPMPLVARPERPEGMPEPVGAVWDRIVGVLEDMGVLTVADGQQLERYARYFHEWHLRQVMLEERYGTTDAIALAYNDEDKVLQGALRDSLKLDAALKQIENNFGLTPAARARIGALNSGKVQVADPREAKFFGRSGS